MIANNHARRNPSRTLSARGLGSRKPAGGAGKKLVINVRSDRPTEPPNFEQTWAKLEEASLAVLAATPVSLGREELYSAVEDICRHGMAERLYSQLHSLLARHVRREVGQLHGQTQDPAVFLGTVQQFWVGLGRDLVTLRAIFLVLDRTYAVPTSGVKPLWEAGLAILRDCFVDAEERRRGQLLDRIVRAVLALLERERAGETIDRSLLASVTRMLVQLHLYDDFLDRPLRDATDTFYHAEMERLLETTDVSRYLLAAEQRLADETERVCTEFHQATSLRPVLEAVERWLLQNAAVTLIERGFNDLVDGTRVDDLARMLQLFRRPGVGEVEADLPPADSQGTGNVPGGPAAGAGGASANNGTAKIHPVDLLARWFAAYVSRNTRAIVQETEEESNMVPKLLDLRERSTRVLEEAFRGDDVFRRAERESFEVALNSRQNKPAQLLAKFMDAHLRSGSKAGSEAETDAILDQALGIFHFLQSKDVFQEFYKKDLAKRLLLGRSASDEQERSMLSRLKTECGADFTSKLEGMFRDMGAARDIMKEFLEEHDAREWGGFEFFVYTLTMNHWPQYPLTQVHVPRELALPQQVFERFYESKYSNSRKLQWHPALGRVTLRARFPKGNKELQVSEYQAMVLLQFNHADELSLEEIRDATGIEASELHRTLVSLSMGKVRVLGKQPKSKKVEEGDRFQFNREFSARLLRLKINTVQVRESAQETRETEERVMQNRKFQIDAAVVRVMKARRSLSHQLLLSEVMRMLRFPVQASDIKKRIEALIERDYMERNEADPQTYDYVA